MSKTNNQEPQGAGRTLRDDHSELDKLINKLLKALDQKNKAKSFELLDLLWARLAVHIRAEHLCLFPSILDASLTNFGGSGGSPQYDEAKNAIDLLREDHDFFMRELGTTVNTLRKQQTRSDNDVISKQLRDVRRTVLKVQSRLYTHNQLEEDHVYKWVNLLLDEAKRLPSLPALSMKLRRSLHNSKSNSTKSYRPHVGNNC